MIHTTDINEFEAVYKLAQELPEDERKLCRAVTGVDYDPQEFMVTLAEAVGDAPYQHLFWSGDKAVAVGGFLQQRPGVFRTWFSAPAWAWEQHGRELTEACRTLVGRMLETGLAHRIETVTLADREKARAWYERIGLIFESTLRGYGVNGEDAVMYVAVRPREAG